MNISTMGYFSAVAEERSFTRAAERLNVTQQTLSANVASLERELGVPLIVRRVPLELTYAGEVFLDYARRFQAETRSMRQEFRDIARDERGRLRVGIAGTRGHAVMPAAIARFREDHPRIDIEIHEDENDTLVRLLRTGLIDMVVATVPERSAGLEVRRLYQEEVVLLASELLLGALYGDGADDVVAEVERSGSLAAMGDCPYMLLGRRDVPGDIARQVLEESGLSPRPVVVSTNAETLIDLAVRGVGACFCPLRLVEAMVPQGWGAEVRTIRLGGRARYWINVAWRQSDHVWSITKTFARVLGWEGEG